MKDKLLYDALKQHPDTEETTIDKYFIESWSSLRTIDAAGLHDRTKMSDPVAKCVLACLISNGGSGISTICSAVDRLAIQTITARALDNYRKLKAKSDANLKVYKEINASHSNYGLL